MPIQRFLSMACTVVVLGGCASDGIYFELDELNQLVRQRRAATDLVAEYGPQQAEFPESVFTAASQASPSPTEFDVVQIDEDLIVTEISAEGQEHMEYDAVDPWAHASLATSPMGVPATPAQAATQASLEPTSLHLGETIQADFCETRTASLKYQATRRDLNGYTEQQYTLFYLDASQNVCGYMTRSVFSAK